MDIICENLSTCGFVRNYENVNNLVVKGYIMLYCKSEKMMDCKRLEYIENHGTPPPSEMLPTGKMMDS